MRPGFAGCVSVGFSGRKGRTRCQQRVSVAGALMEGPRLCRSRSALPYLVSLDFFGVQGCLVGPLLRELAAQLVKLRLLLLVGQGRNLFGGLGEVCVLAVKFGKAPGQRKIIQGVALSRRQDRLAHSSGDNRVRSGCVELGLCVGAKPLAALVADERLCVGDRFSRCGNSCGPGLAGIIGGTALGGEEVVEGGVLVLFEPVDGALDCRVTWGRLGMLISHPLSRRGSTDAEGSGRYTYGRPFSLLQARPGVFRNPCRAAPQGRSEPWWLVRSSYV